MGRIVVFKDLLESLKVSPRSGYILLGERDFVEGNISRKECDLVFHLRDGPNVSNYQNRVSLVIPVLQHEGTEQETLDKILTVYLTNPTNNTFCVDCFSPRFYRVAGQYGGAIEINEEKVGIADRREFYKFVGVKKVSVIKLKIAELDEQS